MGMQIERVNVTDQVVAFIRTNIEDGTWATGSKIPSESQLTTDLGVSRASIRAAIRHLVGLGMLESFHGKGTFVAAPGEEPAGDAGMRFTAEDYKDMEKVLEFRWLLETEACRMAAAKADAEHLQRLRDILQEMQDNVGNQDAFVRADTDFHLEICRGSENPLIVKSMQMVYDEKKKSFKQLNNWFGYRDGIQYHTSILQAMEAGDAETAAGYMEEHLKRSIDRLESES